jgi:hypothetical protein
MTLWRTHDWGKALDLTIGLLDDNSKKDLQSEASVRLANIFPVLEQAEFRAGIAGSDPHSPGRAKVSPIVPRAGIKG